MLKYFKRYLLFLFLMLVFVVGSSLLHVRAQFIKGEILESAIAKDIRGILPATLFFALFYGGYMLLSQIYTMVRTDLTFRISRDIRNDLFDSVLRRRPHQVKEIDRASVVARYTTDLGKVEFDYLSMGSKLLEHVVTILTAGSALFLVNYKVASLAVLFFLLPMLAVRLLKNKLSRAEAVFVTTNKKHLSSVLGYLKGLEAIKNYGVEDSIEKRYLQSLEELKAKDGDRARTRSVSNGCSFLITMISQAAIVIFSAVELSKGRLGAGQFVTIFSLVTILRPPVYWISKLYEGVISSKPAIAAIRAVIDSGDPTIDSSSTEHHHAGDLRVMSRLSGGSSPAVCTSALATGSSSAAIGSSAPANGSSDSCPLKPGEIDIQDLSFSYEDGEEAILDHFSLHVNPGEKVLIRGASGSGKTTLINLLTGTLLPSGGKIAMGGGFSLARQDAFIFNGSVENNITLFGETNREALNHAVDACGIGELLTREDAAENGTNLSGGEKKRVCLARAMVYAQPILILDEPLANIDPRNIANIEKSILSLKDRTIIIISHQVSDALAEGMDRTVILEKKRQNVKETSSPEPGNEDKDAGRENPHRERSAQ
ncbi:MAG TPA: ABC transporter ATP-binding protein [Bacillota bacterium]|nr:ABC transporter ATP-binding protein [Bacillota bacterium]